MLVLVALVCLPLLALALRPWRGSMAWGEIALAASVFWGAYLAVICDALGALYLLNLPWLFASWTLLAIVLAAIQFWHLSHGGWHVAMRALTTRPRMPARLSWRLWTALGAVGCILTLTLITALTAPPNTPDTMTYHLARVMHWIQNGSLAPFPSHLISQDIQPPWDEYALLNLHLLSGSDVLDGLLQWGCFAGCVLGVALIAARLGASRRGQVLAAAFAATIPMAVVQAASVQNDLVVAFWIVCMVYFLLVYRSANDAPTRVSSALLAGLSLGLAALTKGVAYVDALPFLLVFALWAVRELRWRAWRPCVALAILAIALNIGFFTRNVTAFNAPLGSPTATRAFRNAVYTPDVLVLNLTRNIAVEFGSPIPALNGAVTHSTETFLRALGLDPNDPRATMAGSPAFQVRGANGLWLSDGYTTNTIHMLLIVLALLACVALPTLRRQELLGYLLALVGAFVLFSAYLNWQAGSNRLMLGLFVLAAPLVGVVLEELAQRVSRRARLPGAALLLLVFALLLFAAAPRLLLAQSRPLVGPGSTLTTPRIDQYFAVSPAAERGYANAVARIKASGCHQIGFLVSGPQDRAGYTSGAPAWEYPLWALLGETGGGDYQIEDVLVTNETSRLASEQPYARFQPCAVFAILQPTALQQTLSLHGRAFHLVSREPGFFNTSIVIYEPDTM